MTLTFCRSALALAILGGRATEPSGPVCHSRPGRDLLASYWEGIFAITPEQASAMVNGAVAAITAARVPYRLILGSELSPDTAAWFSDAAPHATVEVWADSGHFPHIAHPARFAERLAATA